MATPKLTSTLGASAANALTQLLALDSDLFTILPLTFFAPRAASDFYVADYGAVGDGATDDTAAIQACIDAAEAYVAANNAAARVIFFGGIFLVSNTLRVEESNVHLEGIGGGTDLFTPKGTLILPTETFPNNAYVLRFDWINKTTSLYGNHLRGIAIMALDSSWNFTNTVNGLYWGSSKGLVEDVYIDSLTGLGIGVQGYSENFKVYEGRFRGVTSRRCANGLQYLGSTSDIWWIDCEFNGHTTGAGLNGLGANNYYVACHFTGNKNNVVSGDGGIEELFLGCNFETPREHNFLLDVTNGGVTSLRIEACQFNSNALIATNTYDTIYIGRTAGGNTCSAIIQGNTIRASETNKPRHHINLSGAAVNTVRIGRNLMSGSPASGYINHNANAVRALVNGMGRNVGDPNTTGNWFGFGEEGDRVRDTGSGTRYEHNGTSWVAY